MLFFGPILSHLSSLVFDCCFHLFWFNQEDKDQKWWFWKNIFLNFDTWVMQCAQVIIKVRVAVTHECSDLLVLWIPRLMRHSASANTRYAYVPNLVPYNFLRYRWFWSHSWCLADAKQIEYDFLISVDNALIYWPINITPNKKVIYINFSYGIIMLLLPLSRWFLKIDIKCPIQFGKVLWKTRKIIRRVS